VFLGEIFGPDLLIVVIVVAVLVFGGSAIPKLAKNLGSAKSEFEKGLKEGKAGDGSADKPSTRYFTPYCVPTEQATAATTEDKITACDAGLSRR